ncbi:MAG: hypothetical protein J2P23_10175 [Microlunatus sp.]|nr:hypothetical protein [Microlunatus sp.]
MTREPDMRMIRRWQFCWAVWLIGLVGAGAVAGPGSYPSAVIILVVTAGGGWLLSPGFFPRSITASEAARLSAADGRPIVYWRPGCQFCLRLRFRLGRRARNLSWVDIWSDPAGAAEVRSHADGNETVPTVIIDGQPYVNPDPGWLREWVPTGGRPGGRPR